MIVCFELISSVLGYLRKCAKCCVINTVQLLLFQVKMMDPGMQLEH